MRVWGVRSAEAGPQNLLGQGSTPFSPLPVCGCRQASRAGTRAPQKRCHTYAPFYHHPCACQKVWDDLHGAHGAGPGAPAGELAADAPCVCGDPLPAAVRAVQVGCALLCTAVAHALFHHAQGAPPALQILSYTAGGRRAHGLRSLPSHFTQHCSQQHCPHPSLHLQGARPWLLDPGAQAAQGDGAQREPQPGDQPVQADGLAAGGRRLQGTPTPG